MNRMASISTEQTVMNESLRQTNGFVQMAEQIFGSTPAYAGPNQPLAANARPANSSPSLGTSSRNPASVHPENSRSLPNVVAAVSEEVKISRSASASGSPSTARLLDTDTKKTDTKVIQSPQRVDVDNNARTALSQNTDALRGGSSSQRSSRLDTNKKPTSESGQELVSFISQSSYETARDKLQDPRFIGNLEANNITIFDLRGNSYGARQGAVVFLDKGNRFVRQK
jgi:hypothetical protein